MSNLIERLKANIASQISEGMGAILRKFCDSDDAQLARKHLHQMPKTDWNTLVDMLADAATHQAAAEITRLTEALAASEEARRAERAAVVRECARKTKERAAYEASFASLYKEQDPEKYTITSYAAHVIRGHTNAILALATDADNAALDKLLREARKEGIAACVEAFHAEQTEIWAQEILEHLSIFNLLNIETYEDKISASEAVKKELRDIARILAALEAPPPPTAIAEGRT